MLLQLAPDLLHAKQVPVTQFEIGTRPRCDRSFADYRRKVSNHFIISAAPVTSPYF